MTAFVIGVASLFLVFVLVAALPFAHAGWRRATHRNEKLQIWPVMRRLRIAPEAAPRNDAMMAHAIRRCVMCPSLDDCDQWLASGKADGLGEFCPNASVLEDLRRR